MCIYFEIVLLTKYLYLPEKAPIYYLIAAKKLVNVTINSERIREACELNINILQRLKSSSVELVR